MRTPLVLVGALAILAGAAYLQPPVPLPILVGFIGGGIQPSTRTVTVQAVASADSVYAQLMNAAYVANDFPGKATYDPANLADLSRQARRDDAACVRFTVGATVGPLLCDWNENPAVRIYARERAGGGFGGRAQDVRAVFALPATATPGQIVSMEWHWRGTEGRRSGYYIFELDLVGQAGRQAIPVTVRNPMPYSTHADSIAAGRVAWNTRRTLKDFKPNGVYGEIIASCNDCHISGGADLARYNYPEEVIAARAEFHGLPRGTSRNVASYIRSIQLTPATFPECRPWNPPFQPRPGLDDLPIGAWLCGGGVGAVLETDAQMVGDLFPRGTHPDSIAAVYGGRVGNERTGGINRREMRIADQLPLWNGWLPPVSIPDMALDYDAYCQGEFTICFETSDLGRRDVAGPLGPAWGRHPTVYGTPEQRAQAIETQRRFFQGTSGGVNHEFYFRQNGIQLPVRRAPYTHTGFWHQIANQAFHQALAVRLFDVVTHKATTPWGETGWELANDITCGIPNTPGHPYTWPNGTMLLGPTAPGTAPPGSRVPCAEARGLTAAQSDWTIFAVSCHISNRDGTGGPWDYASNLVPMVGVANNNGFCGHIWYTLAQIIEGPNRWTAPGSLSDENYVSTHTIGSALPGYPTSLETIADGLGMNHRMQGPMRYPRTEGNWKQDHLHHAFHQQWPYQPGQWEATTAQLGAETAANIQAGVAEALLDRWERYPPEAWDVIRGPNFGDLDPRNSTFVAPSSGHPGEWMTPGYYLMHWTVRLRQVGARDRTVDRMARFAASLFDTPSGFAAFMCDVPGCGPDEPPPPPPPPPPPANEFPSVFITAPRAGAKNVRNPVTVTIDATDRDGQVVAVRVFCDQDRDGDREVCGTDNQAPWAITVTLPNTLTQTIHVEGEDDDGAITRTPDRSFRMRPQAVDR